MAAANFADSEAAAKVTRAVPAGVPTGAARTSERTIALRSAPQIAADHQSAAQDRNPASLANGAAARSESRRVIGQGLWYKLNNVNLQPCFPVLNPAASILDIQRHLRGDPEHFPFVRGFKYFYLDWNLDIWRCEVRDRPLGSVFDFDRIPDHRDRCTSCIMSCCRDASTLMHAAVAGADAVDALARARPLAAAQAFVRRSVAVSAVSIAAGLREMQTLLRLARR